MLTVGCSGGDFVTGAGENDAAPPVDTGGFDSLVVPDGDAVPPPVDAPDAVTVDAGPCGGSVTPTTTDLWVDKAWGGPYVGTRSCPFKAVLDATSLGPATTGMRTVHVLSGPADTSYVETGAVSIKERMTLVCEGAANVRIFAGGTCASSPPTGACAVVVEAGGVLDHCLVSAVSSLALKSNVIVTLAGATPPVIKGTWVIGSAATGNGIHANGSVDIGPGTSSSGNGGIGLAGVGAGTIHVIADPTGKLNNAFESNSEVGIAMTSGTTAALLFDGGSVNGNKGHGVRLTNGQSHTITGLAARDNGGAGVTVLGGSGSLKLRKSTFMRNLVNVSFDYGTSNTLDIGSGTSAGENVLGTATASFRALKAGLYLCRSGITGSQAGDGNSWSTCTPPPTQTRFSACGELPTSYVDIAFVSRDSLPGSGDNPVAIPTCKLGL